MSTLQKTFTYNGDPASAPLKDIKIEVEIPVFQYSISSTDNGETVLRLVGGSATSEIQHTISAKDYYVQFDDTFATGKDAETASRFSRYFWDSLRQNKLANFVVQAKVRFLADTAGNLAEQSLEFLHFPKLEPRDLQSRPPVLVAMPRAASLPFNPASKPFIGVNKTVFLQLHKLLAAGAAPIDQSVLMLVISCLTEILAGGPGLLDVPQDQEPMLYSLMGDISGDQAKDVLEKVRKAFPALYDFPLTLPELKKLTIAGKFTITGLTRPATAQDFQNYSLSATLRMAGTTGTGETQALDFVFRPGLVVDDNNSTKFSFPTAEILSNAVLSPVSVSAKPGGPGGLAQWSQDFDVNDPALGNLEISVGAAKAIVLSAAPSSVPAGPKKLRGQVLEFTKKCPLNRLTVVIQAKEKKDDPLWRIVGAATTDASGDFSMPYPYGNFADAQALVSAAPESPAPVRVTDLREGNQTIADDFIYLLVKEIKCPDADTGKDCDCHETKNPARLPDQADLIQSDEYTQDIGGSCVNLSTPNRTISEFDYQAIVRISDPEVANYILKRVEVTVPGIGTVHLSDISRAVSALDAAIRNPIFDKWYDSQKLAGALAKVNALRGITANTSASEITTPLNDIDAIIRLFDVIVPESETDNAEAFKAVMDSARELKGHLKAVLLPLVETHYELVENRPFKPLAGGRGGALGYNLPKRFVPGPYERRPIGLDNPVKWQDDEQHLSLYQAVSVATGHILHYKAEFKADGYSLGNLLSSLPLAPGQKKQIVVFDSSHRLAGAETQGLSQAERLAAGITEERGITDILGGRISESLQGSSSASTRGISAGFGTGGQGSGSSGMYGGSGSAVLGVAGGVSDANANANQNSSRDVSQHFDETLRHSIMQNADSYRQLNASVVTTVQEGQQYGVTSEVVANHNHCHALTILYFEVLRHFAVFQRLSSVEECVFVPLLLTNFTTQNIYKWRDVLASFLLPMPAETYLQPFSFTPDSPRTHPLLKAFDANERIKTNYANVDYPEGSYDDEQILFVKGDMLLRVELQRPRTRYDRIKSLPVTTKTVTTQEIDPIATAKQFGVDAFLAGVFPFRALTNPPGANPQYSTKETQVLVKEAIFDAFMTMDANFETALPADCIRVTNFAPTSITFGGITVPVPALDFFLGGDLDRKLWTAYANLLGYSDVLKMLDYYFKGRLISEWDGIFYNELAPIIFNRIVSSIKITKLSTDFTSASKYTGGERLIRLDLNGTTSLKRNQLPRQLKIFSTSPAALALRDLVTLTIENTEIRYSTAHYNGVLYSGNISDDLLDETTLFIPESAEEKRSPRKEDAYLAYKLIEHLNSNLEYYNRVLWYNLDPERRYMLLDGFNIQVFNDFGLAVDAEGNPLQPRSLASVVKNELSTITGNSLVFPVAPGYKVSQSYILEKTADGPDDAGKKKKKVTLLDHYRPLTPVEPYRISIPSRGVFAEAVQGACNSCEKIETDRLQDWSRFPNTDEPTAIAPVVAPTPGVTDWKAVFKDFAPPVVNIQNAPGAPAPGAGLAGLSDLLGKAGIFKDITGLDATQQMALKTYLSNQENAKAFAEMAKEMATQQHNTQNTGKITDAIKSAKDSGDISKEQAGQLTKDHLQQQIDGGATKKAELDAAKAAAKNDEQKAINEAIRKMPGENLASVETTDQSGGSTTVTAKPAADEAGATAGTGGGGGLTGTIKYLTDQLLLGKTPDGTVKLAEGEAADSQAAALLSKPRPAIRWAPGQQELNPGTIYYGNILIVEADTSTVTYMKGGALWLAYTKDFSQNQLLNAFIDAVVGVEPLVRLANAEVAFLAGIFVGVAEVIGAHVLDLGLKIYANRELAGAGLTAARDLWSAHQCLKRTVPDVIDDLDRTAAWEAILNFPNTVTAEQIAFWMGRVIRAIVSAKEEGLKLTVEIVIKEVMWVTELLTAIDFAVNAGESLGGAIEKNAKELQQRMAQDNVQISETKAARWMRAFAENPEAQRCLEEFRRSAAKLREALQRLMPGIFAG